MAGSGKIAKYVLPHKYEQYDVISVYDDIFPEKFFSDLAHKFTNISAENISGNKQNLLTTQGPERTSNIDLHG